MIILCLACFSLNISLPIHISAIICICRGNLNTSTWFFPPSLDVPFDESTVFGWHMLAFSHLWGGYAYLLCMLTAIPHLTSCSYYIKGCCEHFKLILDECDKQVLSQLEDNIPQSDKIYELVNKAIRLHAEVIK